MSLSDGQRVRVARGQWLTSARKIRHELGKGSLSSITADLAELKNAGAITPRSDTPLRNLSSRLYGTCNGGVLRKS